MIASLQAAANVKQGVALTGRNTTGPLRAAPPPARYVAYASVTDDDDRRQRPLLV